MQNILARPLLVAFGCAAIVCNAHALTITFNADTPTTLDFEMSNLGPTPGDQNILSPSGTWGLFTFVHQFGINDEFAEIGLFVKKLLPVSEAIGTDVIFPQIYGPPDFPLMDNAVGEFGDMYTASFVLKPGSGDNAQEWDWVMKLTAGDVPEDPSGVPDGGTTFALLATVAVALCATRRFKPAS